MRNEPILAWDIECPHCGKVWCCFLPDGLDEEYLECPGCNKWSHINDFKESDDCEDDNRFDPRF